MKILSNEEYQSLLDEIEYCNERIDEIKDLNCIMNTELMNRRHKIYELGAEIIRQEKANVILDNENSELQGRINKAIEFIEYEKTISNMNNPSVFGKYERDLLKILKELEEGNSNENN